MKEYFMPLVGGDYLAILVNKNLGNFHVYGWHNLKGIFDADPRISEMPSENFKMEVLATDDQHCMVNFKKVSEIPEYWEKRIEKLKSQII